MANKSSSSKEVQENDTGRMWEKTRSFIFHETISKGKYSEVIRVTSTEEKRTYAMKMIKMTAEMKMEDVDREILITKLTDHPNIVKFVSNLKRKRYDGVSYWIQMEYCELGNMEAFIRNRDGRILRSETVHQWMLQLSSAVEYLHTHKMVHCDLKPENVFLCKSRDTRIGDFGSARFLPSLFEDGEDTGSTIYNCPEKSEESSYLAADVFSLGCIFLCITTLSQYPKTAPVGAFTRLPPRIRYGGKKVDMISRCLNSDMAARPTAAQIHQELETDDYETLCFHRVSGPKTLLSAGHAMVTKRKGEKKDVLVFSSRPLKCGEEFSLQLKKVNESTSYIFAFGLTATDPKTFEKNMPKSLAELEARGNSLVYESKRALSQGKKFTFWYDKNGTVRFNDDGNMRKFDTKANCSNDVWAFFNLSKDIFQVALQDYQRV